MDKQKIDILNLFNEEKINGGYLYVCAPMVRYSKLEFRTLVRKYGVQLCFTPMIISDSFCRSEVARLNEFTTHTDDSPVIAQFAAKNSIEFLTATELIYPYVDGVDLNCGCPQKWAISDGYGCALLKNPSLLKDMLQTIKRNIPGTFSCSIKLRILEKNLTTTINLCQQLEKCGATFLTIHGRRPWQKSSDPVDILSVTEIKKSVNIPIIFNGDIKTLKDSDSIFNETKCDGVMAARGILSNPTLFTGNKLTSIDCVKNWAELASAADERITFQCFHHHLTFMMEKLMTKKSRIQFNNLTKKEDVFDYLKYNYDINIDPKPLFDSYKNIVCKYDDSLYEIKNLTLKNEQEIKTNSLKIIKERPGKFFNGFQTLTCSNDECEGPFDISGASIFDV